MTKDEAFARLEEMIRDGVGGRADEHTKDEMETLIRSLIPKLTDPYCQGKLRSALTWTPILFSARKHQNWGIDGASKIRSFIHADIYNAQRERTSP